MKNQRGYWSRIEPSWPGLLERLERVGEPRPHVVAQRVGQVLGVDARLGRDVLGQRGPQVLRQALGLGRLAGHERVRLDVEGEVGRRAGDPQLGGPSGGQRVVGRVDLDEREPARVVGESLLGRVGALGVEDAGGGHRRVGPRRGPDPDDARVRGAGSEVDRLRGDVLREVLDPRGTAIRTGVVGVVGHAGMVGRDHAGGCREPPVRPYGTTADPDDGRLDARGDQRAVVWRDDVEDEEVVAGSGRHGDRQDRIGRDAGLEACRQLHARACGRRRHRAVGEREPASDERRRGSALVEDRPAVVDHRPVPPGGLAEVDDADRQLDVTSGGQGDRRGDEDRAVGVAGDPDDQGRDLGLRRRVIRDAIAVVERDRQSVATGRSRQDDRHRQVLRPEIELRGRDHVTEALGRHELEVGGWRRRLERLGGRGRLGRRGRARPADRSASSPQVRRGAATGAPMSRPATGTPRLPASAVRPAPRSRGRSGRAARPADPSGRWPGSTSAGHCDP